MEIDIEIDIVFIMRENPLYIRSYTHYLYNKLKEIM